MYIVSRLRIDLLPRTYIHTYIQQWNKVGGPGVSWRTWLPGLGMWRTSDVANPIRSGNLGSEQEQILRFLLQNKELSQIWMIWGFVFHMYYSGKLVWLVGIRFPRCDAFVLIDSGEHHCHCRTILWRDRAWGLRLIHPKCKAGREVSCLEFWLDFDFIMCRSTSFIQSTQGGHVNEWCLTYKTCLLDATTMVIVDDMLMWWLV